MKEQISELETSGGSVKSIEEYEREIRELKKKYEDKSRVSESCKQELQKIYKLYNIEITEVDRFDMFIENIKTEIQSTNIKNKNMVELTHLYEYLSIDVEDKQRMVKFQEYIKNKNTELEEIYKLMDISTKGGINRIKQLTEKVKDMKTAGTPTSDKELLKIYKLFGIKLKDKNRFEQIQHYRVEIINGLQQIAKTLCCDEEAVEIPQIIEKISKLKKEKDKVNEKTIYIQETVTKEVLINEIIEIIKEIRIKPTSDLNDLLNKLTKLNLYVNEMKIEKEKVEDRYNKILEIFSFHSLPEDKIINEFIKVKKNCTENTHPIGKELNIEEAEKESSNLEKKSRNKDKISDDEYCRIKSKLFDIYTLLNVTPQEKPSDGINMIYQYLSVINDNTSKIEEINFELSQEVSELDGFLGVKKEPNVFSKELLNFKGQLDEMKEVIREDELNSKSMNTDSLNRIKGLLYTIEYSTKQLQTYCESSSDSNSSKLTNMNSFSIPNDEQLESQNIKLLEELNRKKNQIHPILSYLGLDYSSPSDEILQKINEMRKLQESENEKKYKNLYTILKHSVKNEIDDVLINQIEQSKPKQNNSILGLYSSLIKDETRNSIKYYYN